MRRTLYVSDLDGTLLRSDQRTSAYTNRVINSLTEKGMIFSYATARSLVTAKKVTAGLDARIPLIIYNGAFIMDNRTEEIIDAVYFDGSVQDLLDRLFAEGIYPIVYAYINGKEKFSFVPELASEGVKTFAESRAGDIRTNIVQAPEELRKGNLFYITCIGDPAKLKPLYEAYKDRYHCVYQVDIYSRDQWLEIMSREASKANAVRRLKALLNCDEVIAFGDGKNDIDLFEAADRSYAVANADGELKSLATGILLSNDEDGVARFLEETYGA